MKANGRSVPCVWKSVRSPRGGDDEVENVRRRLRRLSEVRHKTGRRGGRKHGLSGLWTEGRAKRNCPSQAVGESDEGALVPHGSGYYEMSRAVAVGFCSQGGVVRNAER